MEEAGPWLWACIWADSGTGGHITFEQLFNSDKIALMSPKPTLDSFTLPELDDDQTVQLAEMFRLMGDPTRLRIILACLAGPTAVGTIATDLGLSASLVSHHLRLLRAARVLRGHRRGKQIFYAAADEHITCVIADMLEHVVEPGGAQES